MLVFKMEMSAGEINHLDVMENLKIVAVINHVSETLMKDVAVDGQT